MSSCRLHIYYAWWRLWWILMPQCSRALSLKHNLRPLRISRSDVVARRSFQQVLQEHHICFILFPKKKQPILLILVHLMQCLLGRSGAFKIGNVVPCRWSVLASVTVVSLRCVRSLQDLNGSHRCVRRISTCPCSMLHALEDQALEPCQRSRTALVCLSNSAEGSAEEWIYVKLEKVTGKIGGSRLHQMSHCYSLLLSLQPSILPVLLQGQVMERLGMMWRGDLGLPHLRDVKLTDRWSRAVAPSPGCFKWSLSRRNCHGWWRLAG